MQFWITLSKGIHDSYKIIKNVEYEIKNNLMDNNNGDAERVKKKRMQKVKNKWCKIIAKWPGEKTKPTWLEPEPNMGGTMYGTKRI